MVSDGPGIKQNTPTEGTIKQHEDIFIEVIDALAKHGNNKDIDYLKSLDDVVQGTPGFSVKKADANSSIQEHALAALPDSTIGVVKKASKGGTGGSLAIELVRRDLTELNVLARTLHVSTEDERREDGGLRRLYNALSSLTELRGALVGSGVDVETKKEWANLLATKIPNLRQLRSTPWHKVALMLQLVAPEAGKIHTYQVFEDFADGSGGCFHASNPFVMYPVCISVTVTCCALLSVSAGASTRIDANQIPLCAHLDRHGGTILRPRWRSGSSRSCTRSVKVRRSSASRFWEFVWG